ncbi:MAG TPA: methyl-accepting chemotaxis protein, partial [Gemmatimonadaceae bacterium]
MRTRYAIQRNTIRSRLWMGFGTIVLLLAVAGVLVRGSFSGISETITASLSDVQTEASLASQLSADIAKTIEAGSRYLDTRDPSAEESFRKYGWLAHQVQYQMNERPNQSATEVATVATIDSKLSAMEVKYALAHRLADLGRMDDARKTANAARNDIDDLLGNIDRLGEIKSNKVATTKEHLANETARRAAYLLVLIGLAVVLALMIVMYTVRKISDPLDVLVRHARRLSQGDLTSRAEGKMPGEFSIL